MIPRIYEGERVYIVAGGPSLKGFDFAKLFPRAVIAINRAYETVPFAPVLWWSDARFWKKHEAELLAHRAPFKATCNVHYRPDDLPPIVHQYRFTGLKGFDPAPDCLRHGNNSAYAAMHLAVHLGAREIVLLGVDMRHGPKGETHWHSGHGIVHMEDTLQTLMAPYFETLVEPLAAMGVRVLNASPDSAVTCWPKCSIEERAPVKKHLRKSEPPAAAPPPAPANNGYRISPDLQGRFLRYATEGDTALLIDVDTIAEAQGLIFLCPKCFRENNGSVGTHGVICWSETRGVPADAKPGPGRWKIEGTSLDDVTLNADPPRTARSVQLNGGCAWHGFVNSGVVTFS